MSEDASREEKLIRAPGDLVSRLKEAANREGKTLYNYVAEIFEQAVRAYEMKRNLKDVLDVYEILEVQKEAGAIFTPRDILEYSVERIHQEDDGTLQRLWYQTGKWYGVYLKEKSDYPVDAFIRLLQEGRWDLNEVTVKRNQETLEFRCISPLASQERTLLLRNFIEGAVHSLGYRTLDQECFRGIIRLKFSPKALKQETPHDSE